MDDSDLDVMRVMTSLDREGLIVVVGMGGGRVESV